MSISMVVPFYGRSRAESLAVFYYFNIALEQESLSFDYFSQFNATLSNEMRIKKKKE